MNRLNLRKVRLTATSMDEILRSQRCTKLNDQILQHKDQYGREHGHGYRTVTSYTMEGSNVVMCLYQTPRGELDKGKLQ